VQNTKQITGAMKMVSAAKLRRAQEKALAARPYAQMLVNVLKSLVSRAEIYDPVTGEPHHPLLERREEKNILLVVISGDKGFAGAFNANVVKTTNRFLEAKAGKNIDIIAIGRKGRDLFRRRFPYAQAASEEGEYKRAAPVEIVGRWSEIPSDRVHVESDADGLVAIGGGSAIDTAKWLSAITGLALVSVPTTYSGAEWTEFFGVRDRERRMRGGGAGSYNAAIVYDVSLTLDLPRDVTGGTALNALAHSCEALYVRGRDPGADPIALEGAELISTSLPRVLERGNDVDARTELLRGAARAGEALRRSGLALGHAMAQAIGGRYGLPHGALNAICLPPALRFNAQFVPPELLGGLAAERAEELKLLAGFTTLGVLDVPEQDLPALAQSIAERPGALANPRPARAAEILKLLRSVY